MKKRNPGLNFSLVLALLLALPMLVAACSDGETPVPPSTAAVTTAPATTAAPASLAPTPAAPTTAAITTAVPTTAALPSPTPTVAPTPTPPPVKPLVIGLITTRTGPLAYSGEMLERGFMLGLDYFTGGTNKIAGREVKVVVEDDTGTPEKAVEAARKLAQQEGAEILVGAPGSPQALAIAAVNDQELKKIFIVTGANDPALTGANFSRYTFRTSANTDQEAVIGASYAVSQTTQPRVIASLYRDTASGQGANAAWKETAILTTGLKWVEVAVPTTATLFTSYIQRVLTAAPDVLVLNWDDATAPELLQQMKDFNLFSRMVVIGPVGDLAALSEAGDTLIGTQGVTSYWNQFPRTAENDALVKAFKDKYNTIPDLTAPDGFAAVSAIQTALEKTGGDTGPEKLIPQMEGMSFAAPKGKEIFRKEDHQALQPMYVVKMIKDNTGTYDFPIPQLIKEYSAEEAAPPIRRK